MRINDILAMHKILTVWTKFLHTFILWMLLSKSDFLNVIDKSCFDGDIRNLQMKPEIYLHPSIMITPLNTNVPNVLIELSKNRTFPSEIMKYAHRREIRTLFQSKQPSTKSSCQMNHQPPNVVLFPKNILTTFSSVATQQPPGFTTEQGIFTGIPITTPEPPAPLSEFEVSTNDTFGTFMYMQISWNATINITKIELQFTNAGGIIHSIEMPSTFLLEKMENIFSPESGRIGFIYHLGGLKKSRRYFLQAWCFAEGVSQPLYDKQYFLTNDQDMHDSIYDLNGIFMVLGISTILMVMVMVCVGYEKLIHQKKRMLVDFICCARRKPKRNRVNDGSISPEPLNRENDVVDLPAPEDEYVRAGPSRAFAF